VDGILAAIQSISDEARRALADPELSRDALLSALKVSSFPSIAALLLVSDFIYPSYGVTITGVDQGEPRTSHHPRSLPPCLGEDSRENLRTWWTSNQADWCRWRRVFSDFDP
jgi:hypothetical protein